MTADRKQKLIDLGPEVLANALLELSNQNDIVDTRVDQLIATPQENIAYFKRKLSSLKRSTRFIDWKESSHFAYELEMLLHNLQLDVVDPIIALRLIEKFYQLDSFVFNRCDDSNGCIGNVYRYDAQSLFEKFATQCADKKAVMNIMLNLCLENEYGARDTVIDCASSCLSESEIRVMLNTLQNKLTHENDNYQRQGISILIESLARQIKDAKLFEKTRVASWGSLNAAAYIDIAQVYFESGEIEAAKSWIDKIPAGDTFKAYEREKLLEQIYRKQGDDEKLISLLHDRLKSNHSTENLEALLSIIGNNKRDATIQDEVKLIMKDSEFRDSNMEFLIQIRKIDQAEQYLFDRADKLNGAFYLALLPLAKAMHREKRFLAATFLYRSLLTSILERGYSKAYPHGVRYLKILDDLADKITDWINFPNHEFFKNQLALKHGRKKSFWSKYGMALT